MQRETVVTDGPLAGRMARAAAAQGHAVGRELLTLPQLAARLVGGFVSAPGPDELYPAITAALERGDFSSLQSVAHMPGMPRAVVSTLMQAWKADLDLSALAAQHPRIADLAEIERRVREAMLPAWLVLPDLRSAALARGHMAPRLLGSIRLENILCIDPIWRPLIAELARQVPVSMSTAVPELQTWFAGEIIPLAAGTPSMSAVDSCADPRSEVVEALRWVRSQLASGVVAADLAISSPSTQSHDEYLLVLREHSALPIYFAHGVPALGSDAGQACAALADILVRGLDQDRVRRLIRALPPSAALDPLPTDWTKGLRAEAGLFDLTQWHAVLQQARGDRESGDRAEEILLPILRLLEKGTSASAEAGELLLGGESLAIWKRALRSAPASAVAISLQQLRVPDRGDPANSVVWCPADQLASSPRAIVRLIGLSVRNWPRMDRDDPLLPDHILSRRLLRPLSVTERDRLSFRIIVSQARELALSMSRRNSRGGIQSPSSLWPRDQARVLARLRVPEHAYCETDRLLARPADAQTDPRVTKTRQLWRAWLSPALSAHDGLLPEGHPAVEAALARTHSASSLRMLLRDQQAYVWMYGLGWYPRDLELRPLTLDKRSFGELVHEVLARGIRQMDGLGGVQSASSVDRVQAFADAALYIAGTWPLQRTVPPGKLWSSALSAAQAMALSALLLDDPGPQRVRTWTELGFGEPNEGAGPWGEEAVQVLGAPLMIKGRIDRLDLADNRSAVRITDYKTSRLTSAKKGMVLAGGAELQRVLYATAARQLLPDVPRVVARLTYLRDGAVSEILAGDELEGAIGSLGDFANRALTAIAAGKTLPGPDAFDEYSKFRLARPADLSRYRGTKGEALETAQTDLLYGWSLP